MVDVEHRRTASSALASTLGRLLIAVCLAGALTTLLWVGRRLTSPVSDPPSTASEEHLRALEDVYPGWTRVELERLQNESWLRPYAYEPFTGFKERPFHGRYVNVEEPGFRWSRDQCAWPPDPSRLNVFFFGGSTLFGYGVADADTIVSQARKALSEAGAPGPCVYNFGRGWYYSSQERVLFERLLVSGFRPQLAVFVDGLNEFLFAEDEPRFTDQMRAFVREINAHLEPGADPGAGAATGVVRDADDPPPDGPSRPDPEAIVERYRQHQRLTRAIGEAFSVRTAFVWQAVPVYDFDLARHPFRARVEEAAWAPLVRAGYEVMDSRRARGSPTDLIWCADVHEAEGGPLYVDGVHYSPEMCGRMARCIAAGLR